MSRRAQLLLAACVAGLGVLLLLVPFAGPSSVREWVDGRYTKSPSTDPALTGAAVYTSSKSASSVVDEISASWKPADRHSDPTGHFLRYQNDMVVVQPTTAGTRIIVDSERRGYARWYPFIGGYWGTYSGGGEDVRGGGPGAGK